MVKLSEQQLPLGLGDVTRNRHEEVFLGDENLLNLDYRVVTVITHLSRLMNCILKSCTFYDLYILLQQQKDGTLNKY